eukprot:scaffold22756_cov13-Tisochrysis_lutea.AAC.1
MLWVLHLGRVGAQLSGPKQSASAARDSAFLSQSVTMEAERHFLSLSLSLSLPLAQDACMPKQPSGKALRKYARPSPPASPFDAAQSSLPHSPTQQPGQGCTQALT